MKFIIKHEIPGRIRVHMVQPKMTFEEADILLYYLVNLENVTKAKVYERTQDAVIYYEKDRREIIKALQKFGYDRVTVPEGLTEHSGRQMNAEYQEKLLMKVVMRFGGKLLIPDTAAPHPASVGASATFPHGGRHSRIKQAPDF